jgi:hypothetical protein
MERVAALEATAEATGARTASLEATARQADERARAAEAAAQQAEQRTAAGFNELQRYRDRAGVALEEKDKDLASMREQLRLLTGRVAEAEAVQRTSRAEVTEAQRSASEAREAAERARREAGAVAEAAAAAARAEAQNEAEAARREAALAAHRAEAVEARAAALAEELSVARMGSAVGAPAPPDASPARPARLAALELPTPATGGASLAATLEATSAQLRQLHLEHKRLRAHAADLEARSFADEGSAARGREHAIDMEPMSENMKRRGPSHGADMEPLLASPGRDVASPSGKAAGSRVAGARERLSRLTPRQLLLGLYVLALHVMLLLNQAACRAARSVAEH